MDMNILMILDLLYLFQVINNTSHGLDQAQPMANALDDPWWLPVQLCDIDNKCDLDL